MSGAARPRTDPTDRRYLTEVAYADSAKLRSRRSIYAYRTPRNSMREWTHSLVDWPAGSAVLDVGCGPGSHLAGLTGVRAVGVDVSLGMAREAKAHAPAAVADAARLPFAEATFDRVLALHMLYHCDDIPAAVRELRRVLRPGGVLIAVTNAPDHMLELRELRRTVTGVDPLRVTDRFSLDNGGDFLRAVFADVRLEPVEGEVAVPSAQPVVEYVASMAGWDPTIEPAFTAALDSVIERDGAFRARTRSGAFICR